VFLAVLNALVAAPAEFPHSENLFMLQRAFSQGDSPSQSYPDYRACAIRNHASNP